MGCVNQLLQAHNVRVVGTGDKWLVFGHGFGSDQTVWQFILPYFMRSYKILLFDLMGAGSTNPQHFNFARYATLHAYADDLLTILDEMEIESCIYIGHSMSGMIGCIASIERPSVFEKLVLISTSPRYVIFDFLKLSCPSIVSQINLGRQTFEIPPPCAWFPSDYYTAMRMISSLQDVVDIS